MAREIGDLWPQVSGSASLGAEMTNDGFTGEIRPLAHVHMNSGVWHDPFGSSGVLRFSHGLETATVSTINGKSPGFEVSHDGGKTYPLRLGASDNTTASLLNGMSFIEAAEARALVLLGSGQILLYAFGGSGRLEYRSGPHHAWHVRNSYSSTDGPLNDGFWPIPHSGQIAQMIVTVPTLQQAYVNGHTISTSLAEGGPVAITGTDQSALRIAVTEGQGAHLELSGVIIAPTLFNYQGSILLARHSHNLNDPFLATATEASLKASSPGLPTLWFNTGTSGIINVRTGSGIAQFFNNAASAEITDVGLYVNLPAAAQTNTDRFYGGLAQSGIRFLVDGFYRISYVSSVTKYSGELTQQANTELHINDQWGRVFRILGSQSYAIIRDATINNTNTCNGQAMMDMNAGEFLNIFVESNSVPIAPNAMRINARACSIHLEYIGPQRASSTIRQEIVP